MIFDLKSGKRRRVVQIVFGFLAFVFFISFVGFGIGSDVSGGIFDAIGLGGDDSSVEPAVRAADRGRQRDPGDRSRQRARPARPRQRLFPLRHRERGDDRARPACRRSPTTARAELEQSVAAWQRYLETKPKRPPTAAAAEAAQAYQLLLDPAGAAEAQAIVAEAQGTSAAFYQLALYLYADGKIEAGDAAGERAVEAADSSTRSDVRKSVERLGEQAREQKRRLAQQQEEQSQGSGGAGIEDPFGGLSGGGATTVPTP